MLALDRLHVRLAEIVLPRYANHPDFTLIQRKGRRRGSSQPLVTG